jgi:hypothetical protein
VAGHFHIFDDDTVPLPSQLNTKGQEVLGSTYQTPIALEFFKSTSEWLR